MATGDGGGGGGGWKRAGGVLNWVSGTVAKAEALNTNSVYL